MRSEAKRVLSSAFRRQSVPIVLFALGVVAGIAAASTSSTVWRPVWIGVASTLLTAGLVDGSAPLETRRRERAMLRIAGDRIGYVHQRLLMILGVVYDIRATPLDGAALRALDRPRVNLRTTLDQVDPPRTRQVWVMERFAELEEAFNLAMNIGTQTAEAARFVSLYAALNTGLFVAWLRSVSVMPILGDDRNEYVNDAADLLDAVQREFRFFARQGGASWRWGQLP